MHRVDVKSVDAQSPQTGGVESLTSRLESGAPPLNRVVWSPSSHDYYSESGVTHFWLNGYVNKQNCRIWSEANPQVYVETPLHPEKLTVWCALWAGGILLQKR
ncbi:hypothetical protein TNCV_1144831 [Trichonephila clavipes]|nr:hypothetical protein TNCV_1144831 [Trichonephila clavipes]